MSVGVSGVVTDLESSLGPERVGEVSPYQSESGTTGSRPLYLKVKSYTTRGVSRRGH